LHAALPEIKREINELTVGIAETTVAATAALAPVIAASACRIAVQYVLDQISICKAKENIQTWICVNGAAVCENDLLLPRELFLAMASCCSSFLRFTGAGMVI
jgi:hypothetical protein